MGDEVKPPAAGVKVPSKGTGKDNYDFDQKIDTDSLGNATVEAKGGNRLEKNAYGEIEPMKRVENPDVKNPDSTSGDTAMKEVSLKEKGLDQVEDVEDHDDVPRNSNATINDEDSLTEKGPDVPRSSANIGNEKAFSAEDPKVPSEVSETDVTMRGRQAERQRQMDKIASARREHAQRFAGQLLERGIIKEAEAQSFVEDLSSLPLDRMQAHVALMMNQQPKKVSASVQHTLTTPIVKESETFVQQDEVEEVGLADKLAGMFTIGDMKSNRAIRQAMVDERLVDNKLGW
jgi:polyhydroxyalkanoate synthesis regulator phasin